MVPCFTKASLGKIAAEEGHPDPNKMLSDPNIKLAPKRTLIIAAVAVLLAGLILAALDSSSQLLTGWIAYTLLLCLAAVVMLWANKGLQVSSLISKIALSAFILRLGAGVALMILLPVAGHQTSEVSLAGYVFRDALIRDTQAWRLASSSGSLLSAFSGSFSGDQYGGMLAISAAVYRYVSPDSHRPALILILTALASSVGVLFLWKAAQGWLNEKVVLLAAIIFAFYPESILLGSSQMREAFVISSAAIAFFGVQQVHHHRKQGWVWIGLALLTLLFFHPPSALTIFITLFGLWLLERRGRFSWKPVLIFLGILILALVTVISIWSSLPSLEGTNPATIFFTWLGNNFSFQAHQLERGSGWIQKLSRQVVEGLWPVVVVSYGLTRPVLPAAIFDPAPLIWVFINVLRAAGWYALAPVLLYGLYASFKATAEPRRRQLIWLGLAIWAWIIIASANAGGDQWDNPRYRALFLTWQALVAGWAVWWAVSNKDPWLKRLFLVEGIFLLLLSYWYATRIFRIGDVYNIWPVVAGAAVIGALVLAAGWILDRRKRTSKLP
jgi:hypothetical protein